MKMYKKILDPRLSFNNRFKAFVQFLLSIGLVGLTLYLLYTVPYQMLRQERVRAFGEVETTGVAIVLEKGNTTTKYETPWYTVTYKYVDGSGYTRTAKSVIKGNAWHRLQPGSKFKLWYAKQKPDLVRVEHQIESDMQIWIRKWLRGSIKQ